MSERAQQARDGQEAVAVSSHGVSGYAQGCRCSDCKTANKHRADSWRERNPDKVQAQSARAYASYQSRTRAKATKKPSTRWTQDEVALVLRDDLTLEEMALRLGRSYSSVQKKRQALRAPGLTHQLDEGDVKSHGVSGYSRGCRCDLCREAKRQYQATPTARQSSIERQQRTRLAAKRHRFQWTGPELEIAAREDLTVTEIAKMLGRSYSSVANMRHRLNIEPKIINLAGVPRGVDAESGQ